MTRSENISCNYSFYRSNELMIFVMNHETEVTISPQLADTRLHLNMDSTFKRISQSKYILYIASSFLNGNYKSV